MFFLKKRAMVLGLDTHPRWKELRFSLSRVIRNPLSLAGLVLIFIFLMVAVLAPVIVPPPKKNEPFRIPHEGYGITPKPPSKGHPFGRAI